MTEEKNIALWESVSKTNPNYTKPFTGAGGYSGTAINGTSVVMEATKQWGPIGLNWGYKVLEERVDTGATVFNDEGEITGNTLINTIHLEVWVKKSQLDPEWQTDTIANESSLAKVDHFGHTPFVTWNRNYKSWQTDMEATKKSLTDALKKCLSMFGFNADIFLGLYDDVSYVGMLKEEAEIDKSDDKLETHIKQKQEYDEWFLNHFKIIETAVNFNELELVFKTCYRKIQRKEDREGLLKMTRAKDKRFKQLQEKTDGQTLVRTDQGNDGIENPGGDRSGNGDSSRGHDGGDSGELRGKGEGDSNHLSEHGSGHSGSGQGNKKASTKKKSARKSEGSVD